MQATRAEITDYWSRHQDECRLSVDWADGKVRCWRCAHRRRLHRCHVVPRALGGSDEASNLVLLCAQCHAEAPNVADASFMWVWLRAHRVPFYGTYWQERGWREYEFIYGRKPFIGIEESESLLARFGVALRTSLKHTSTHWGQGQPNPATIAWLIRELESQVGAAAAWHGHLFGP